MYGANEMDLWHQHREELLREARDARLAGHLKASRPKGAARLWSRLLGRGRKLGEAAGGLPAGEGRCA